MGKIKSSALERIRANLNRETKSRKVNAWSTEDDEFLLYWQPITLADKQKIQKHAQGDDFLTSVYTVIFKAENEKGDPLFTIADKSFLMNEAGSSEVEAIAVEILEINAEALTPEK